MIRILKVILTVIVLLLTFGSSTAKADNGVTVYAPSSAKQGTKVEVDYKILNNGSNTYTLFIGDCSNPVVYFPHKDAVPLNGNDNYSNTYQWDTAAAGTDVCSHRIILKTFDAEGNMIGNDQRNIDITAGSTSSSSSSSSSSGSSSSSSSSGGPTEIHTRFGNFRTIPQYVNAIYNTFLPYGISAVILVIIWSGYLLMTSAGNPDAATNAKKYIAEALAGLALLILANLVIQAIWPPI
jgi:hypothetical protein